MFADPHTGVALAALEKLARTGLFSPASGPFVNLDRERLEVHRLQSRLPTIAFGRAGIASEHANQVVELPADIDAVNAAVSLPGWLFFSLTARRTAGDRFEGTWLAEWCSAQNVGADAFRPHGQSRRSHTSSPAFHRNASCSPLAPVDSDPQGFLAGSATEAFGWGPGNDVLSRSAVQVRLQLALEAPPEDGRLHSHSSTTVTLHIFAGHADCVYDDLRNQCREGGQQASPQHPVSEGGIERYILGWRCCCRGGDRGGPGPVCQERAWRRPRTCFQSDASMNIWANARWREPAAAADDCPPAVGGTPAPTATPFRRHPSRKPLPRPKKVARTRSSLVTSSGTSRLIQRQHLQ